VKTSYALVVDSFEPVVLLDVAGVRTRD